MSRRRRELIAAKRAGTVLDPAASFTECLACNGTGTRDWLSGAPCMQCINGWVMGEDPDDLPDWGDPEDDDGE